MKTIDATSDDRTANNAVRHEYRVLSEAEKENMLCIKDLGAQFLTHLDGLGASRELSIARTKVEEAVMWAVKHITAVLVLAAIVVVALAPPVLAGDGTVTIPWGDWIADGAQTLASLCLAALSWVLARWAPQWVRMQLTEQLLSRAVDYGIAVVAGAARGKVLDIPVANEVIREAAAYAVANAPATAKWLGATLEPKLLARLGAAGHLPENAVRVPSS
jgi:hypothetical protein